MFDGYLDTADIQALVAAAVSGDVFQFDRALWLTHIHRGFVTRLRRPNADDQQQFRLDLAKMNTVERLEDGSVPLEQYLKNIAELLRSAGQSEATVFDRLASKVGNRSRGVRLAAAARSAPEVVRKEAIVHQDDTLRIGFLSAALTVGQAVARISVPRFEGGEQQTLSSGRPWTMTGTGWLIGTDLLVTNHHVINAREANEPDASPSDLALQAGGATAAFDFDEEGSEPRPVAVSRLELADADLDYAVLRLSRPVERTPLRVRDELLTMTPSTYLPVNIIQHPRGRPKRVALRNNLMSGADADTIRYFTDTDFGSSGAPVCDDSWRVVALHRGAEAVEDVNFQGKSTAFVNFGTQITRVLADVKQRMPALHGEIAAAQR